MPSFLLAIVVCASLAVPAGAQSSSTVPWKCTGRDSGAQLQPSYGGIANPAYPDALSLFLTLKDRGIEVSCVARSTMDHFATGQVGAAIFRTDKGSFQALFFATRQQVQDVRFAEHHQADWYTHVVSTPPPSMTRTWNSHWPEHYVRHENVLLMTIKNEDLAKLLQNTLEP